MKRSPILVAAVLLAAILVAIGCGNDAGKGSKATTAAAPAEPITADPAGGRVRGTVIMVHGGAWVGHIVSEQRRLMGIPGRHLLDRGWRVVSVDMQEGAAGLQDVLDVVASEIARKTSSGPLCLYGESSGAQMVLVAAARQRAVDCVIGLGTPADLPLYESEGAPGGDANKVVRLVASRMKRFFGTTKAELATWDPVTLAPQIRAPVLLMREGDDQIVSAAQAKRFKAASPETKVVTLEPGDPADASTKFMHGTISARGRTQYADAIDAFLARADKAR
jgi:acetyl esterase/lipase